MTANEKASTTMMWIKQLSTTTVNTLAGKVRAFMGGSRIKKRITIGVGIWLLVNLVIFLIFQNRSRNIEEAFYANGVSEAAGFAEAIGSSLLESDILALNVAVGEIAKKTDNAFAAVLDHQDKVMAHNDPAKMNKPLASLRDEQDVSKINGVAIISGADGDRDLIVYKKDVTYSGVKIGMICFGKYASVLSDQVGKYGIFSIVFIILSAGATAALIFFIERASMEKDAKIRKELEGMTKIGPYILTKKIAQGGMAELYLSDYIRGDGFRRTVAVKKVLPHLAENTDFINMFIREARLAALLQHPNIVQIADFGNIENAYFIAMEYIDGKNLAEIMAHVKRGLDVDMAVFIILQISNGLEYSHSKKDDKTGEPLNIVHRDVSPQNMLISLQGEVKVSDFGISKATSEPSFTLAGVIKGKLSYMSPEQARGEDVDHQVDIYALGLVFYEILTGKRLYKFSNDIEAIREIPKMEIPPVIEKRPDIPVDLNNIVMKCLEKEKAYRYQTTKELIDDLMQLKTNLGITFDASNLSQFMSANFSKEH